MKNYHTHTTRCMHAIGSEEEYNLSRCENIIQDEVLMNVLDTTMRISIGDKYFKITENDRYKIHDNGGTEKSDDRDRREALPCKTDLCMASSATGYLLG